MIQVFNIDCMIAMKDMPDKAYELAIVDPPYGINADLEQNKNAVSEESAMVGHGKNIKIQIGIMKYQP